MDEKKSTPTLPIEQTQGEHISASGYGKDSDNLSDIQVNRNYFSIEKLRAEIKEKTERKTKWDILHNLIGGITRADFLKLKYPDATEEELDECREKGEKIKAGEYKVLVIEEVRRHAKERNWMLAKTAGFTYIYNGAWWEVLPDEDVKKFLSKCAMKMGMERTTAKDVNFADPLFKQFQFDSYTRTPEFDKGKVLINLKNGTFEVTFENQSLRAFNPDDFLTYQLPFRYDPGATAPLFKKYLDRVLPDPTAQAVLAEYAGYLFIRNGTGLKFEKCLILYGSGANGKSVFYEVLTAMLGAENVARYPLQELTDNTGYYRAEIANKLVNYASEISRQMNADLFKKLASGEPFTARSPYGKPFEVENYAKMIFNANELPRDTEQTNAFFRRFLIVPFSVTIPDEEQDKELHTKIIENELPGVFNWVMGGLKRLLENKKFTECQAAADTLNQYRIDSDTVASFLIEKDYQKSLEFKTQLKDLYQEYKAYCYEDGYKACSNRTFADRLRAKGYELNRSNGVRYVYAEKKCF